MPSSTTIEYASARQARPVRHADSWVAIGSSFSFVALFMIWAVCVHLSPVLSPALEPLFRGRNLSLGFVVLPVAAMCYSAQRRYRYHKIGVTGNPLHRVTFAIWMGALGVLLVCYSRTVTALVMIYLMAFGLLGIAILFAFLLGMVAFASMPFTLSDEERSSRNR
jgi:MFS family permease